MGDAPRPPASDPIACPKCGEMKGQPYDVFIAGKNVAITVHLECQACKYRWTADAPSPLIRRDRPF